MEMAALKSDDSTQCHHHGSSTLCHAVPHPILSFLISAKMEAPLEPPRAVSAKWTAREGGSVAPPTSDDYAEWTVAQLRKECTSRRLRLTRATPAAERVRLLQAMDERRAADARRAEALSARSQSEHAGARLANVLFSPALGLAGRVSGLARENENENFVRAGVDKLWADVADEFNQNEGEHGELVSGSRLFEGIDPGLVIPHDARRLRGLWESMTRQFIRAKRLASKQQRWQQQQLENQGQEGDDEQDAFFKHCHGSVIAFYLHEWLQIKPEMLPVVESGLLLRDPSAEPKKRGLVSATEDSHNGIAGSVTDPQHGDTTSTSSQEPESKRLRQIGHETATNAAQNEAVSEQSTIDELLKLHQLIGLLEDRIDQRKASESQRPAVTLEASLALYREKVARLEDIYRQTL